MRRALETTFDVTNSFYVTAIASAEKGEIDEIPPRKRNERVRSAQQRQLFMDTRGGF